MQIPADVPMGMRATYRDNFASVTHEQGRVLLFAADQKIEHLNTDFYGEAIPADAAHPGHLFAIAASGHASCFATQLGLIARYAQGYPTVPAYIAKLNSKTNLYPSAAPTGAAHNYGAFDPISTQLWSISDVVKLQKESGVPIKGVGYTLYLGSRHEATMLAQAAQVVWQAHQYGLLAILWVYPRGQAVHNDTDVQLLAGSAGVANALGADVVKIKAPHNPEDLSVIKQAAGNTLVICSGGPKVISQELLTRVRAQVQHGRADGAAIGRNVFQCTQQDGIGLLQQLSDAIYR